MYRKDADVRRYLDECRYVFLERVQDEAEKRFAVTSVTAKDYASAVLKFHHGRVLLLAKRHWEERGGDEFQPSAPV
jgi:hypothetical protein